MAIFSETGSGMNRYLRYLAMAYVISLPWLSLPEFLPGEARLQAPELVFLIMLPFIAVSVWRNKDLLSKGRWWWAGGIALASLVSALVNGTGIGEGLARGYLFLLSLFMALLVQRRVISLSDLLRFWRYGVGFAVGVGYVYYGIALMGGTKYGVSDYAVFPYFGAAMRLKGPTGHPSMLCLLLALPWWMSYRCWRTGRGGGLWLLLFAPAILLTFAKEALFIVVGTLILDPLMKAYPRVRVVAFGGTVLLFMGLTHYLIVKDTPEQRRFIAESVFTSGRIVSGTDSYLLAETCYVATKRAATALSEKQPVLGYGPGGFNAALEELPASVYPEHLPAYDPHSSWWGMWAEVGLIGVIALLLFVVLPFNLTARLPEQEEVFLFGLLLLSMLFISVNKDVLNYRFLWVAYGAFIGAQPRTFGSVSDRPA